MFAVGTSYATAPHVDDLVRQGAKELGLDRVPLQTLKDLAARSLRDPSDQDESPNIYVSQTDKKRLVLGEMKATSTLGDTITQHMLTQCMH
eukprot:jgi/Chrzof1/10504/Cz05g01080.t1